MISTGAVTFWNTNGLFTWSPGEAPACTTPSVTEVTLTCVAGTTFTSQSMRSPGVPPPVMVTLTSTGGNGTTLVAL